MASGYALPTGPSDFGDTTPAPNTHTTTTLSHDGATLSQESSRVAAGLGINGVAYPKNSNFDHSHDHNDSPGTPSKSRTIVGSLSSIARPKPRARGRSDLGRSASVTGNAYRPSLGKLPTHNTWARLSQELLTVALICLPLYAASLSTSSAAAASGHEHAQHLADGVQHLRDTIQELDHRQASRPGGLSGGLGEALVLSSVALLGMGVLNTTQRSKQRVLSAGYASPRVPVNKKADVKGSNAFNYSTAGTVGMRCLSIFLPLFAAVKLGGWRTCLIMLSAHAAGLTRQDHLQSNTHGNESIPNLSLQGAILVAFVTDLLGVTSSATYTDIILGYLAIASAVRFARFPVDTVAGVSRAASSSGRSTPASPSVAYWRSPSLRATGDVSASSNTNLVAGAVLLVLAVLVWITDPFTHISASTILAGFVSITSTVAAAQYASIALLRQRSTNTAYMAGVLVLVMAGSFTSWHRWTVTISNIVITGLFVVAILLDSRPIRLPSTQVPHAQGIHAHAHHHGDGQHSSFTAFLLNNCEPDSLIHSILCEKDSRRIAYFTCLNFAFMLVQGMYGYLSGSLGLLSDTVHMFFDCLGLVVGLGAAVASKWPRSRDRPFGWGKLNTLAGFGNGVFLMLVSVEFVFEAAEGIVERRELRRVTELLIVSTLGLLVNLVGLFAFGHAHAGHDHGHGDDHGHDHNENMHGIFLHVAADAGGSLAVIISTALTIYRPWYLWDPLATIIIAVLIFAAAVPLVMSSGQKLLLIVPQETEYMIKNFLQAVGEVRGVQAYATPRFWTIDEPAATGHDHHHHHDHGHEEDKQTHHGHQSSHDHDHSHSHAHDHSHNHDHPHNHDHSHIHDDHHHHHDHNHKHSHGHDHADAETPPPAKLIGCIHITAVPFADLEDVRDRVEELALSNGMQLVIDVTYDS